MAGVDAEAEGLTSLASVPAELLVGEVGPPLAAGEGATVFDELLARDGKLEGLTQMIELSDFVDFGICFIFHIVIVYLSVLRVYHQLLFCQALTFTTNATANLG